MEARYNPQGVEERWQQTWEQEGLYGADAGRPARRPFVVAHPPPNVTGELHMGHALQLSLADALVRWHRMRGFNTLFQPGYDHAGISTQNAVEKHLAREGTTRQELGREAFEQRVWEWLRLYGAHDHDPVPPHRRLARLLARALHDGRGLRPRGDALLRAPLRARAGSTGPTGSSTGARSTRPSLSDLELVHEDVDDALIYVRYPFADGDGRHRRSRPRARRRSSADVAVAVHPDDERYRDAVGREVVVPWVEREVPVIADERVEPEFGTGALKITPGHDPLDFEIGRDHGLDEPMVIGPDGRMNERRGRARRRSRRTRPSERILDWLPRARPAREARAVPPRGRALRALREPDRAADLAPVVVLDGAS